MKIRISELRKIVQHCILLEDARSMPKVTAGAVTSIFNEFKINPATFAEAKKNAGFGVINAEFSEMIENIVDGLNSAASVYSSTSQLLSDEKSLKMIRSVLTDPANYGAEEVPVFIKRDLSRLVEALGDLFEMTVSGRGGSQQRDDEKLVVNVMQAINRLATGADMGGNGINILGDLFYAYDMRDEARAANIAQSRLYDLYDMLQDDKQEGKFKELTNKFSKGSESRAPALDRSQMKTKID